MNLSIFYRKFAFTGAMYTVLIKADTHQYCKGRQRLANAVILRIDVQPYFSRPHNNMLICLQSRNPYSSGSHLEICNYLLSCYAFANSCIFFAVKEINQFTLADSKGLSCNSAAFGSLVMYSNAVIYLTSRVPWV